MTVNTYPPFIIPLEFTGKRRPSEWTNAEARQYKEWLLATMDVRIVGLLSYFHEMLVGNAEEDLRRIGEKVANSLKQPEFSGYSNNDFELTAAGRALAADMGLLVASYLLKQCPALHWTIIQRAKKDVNYQLPIIVGFDEKHIQLEPIRVSTSIALGILKGLKDNGAWSFLFTYCRDHCPKPSDAIRIVGSEQT